MSARRHSPADPSLGPVDPILLAAVLILITGGLVMVYSASVHTAVRKFGDGFHYVARNGVYVALGLVVMWTASRMPYRWLQRMVGPLVVLAVGSMIAVLAMGYTAGNATRWFRLGPVNVQPTELAKLVLVVYLAHFTQRKAGDLGSLLRGYVPPLLVTGLLMFFSLMQPDFGTALIFGTLAVTMLFVAGTRLAYVAATLFVLVPATLWAIFHNSMRFKRFLAFLDPFAYQQGAGYQIVNSLGAMANGGPLGVGLGQGQQKVGYIPEAQTDFVAAVIGEELGLVGTIVLLTLFAVVVVRGLRAARRAPDRFGQALGFGLTFLLAIQVLINVGVAYGMLPPKGLTLPLISYGGTSMVATCLSIGMLLHLSRLPVRARRRSSRPTRTRASNPGAVPLDLAAAGGKG